MAQLKDGGFTVFSELTFPNKNGLLILEKGGMLSGYAVDGVDGCVVAPGIPLGLIDRPGLTIGNQMAPPATEKPSAPLAPSKEIQS